MQHSRQQLTLFVPTQQAEAIEQVRSTYNPIQFSLIAAHVTLCREHEFEDMNNIIANLRSAANHPAIKIGFDAPTRFDNGKGALMSAKKHNPEFYELRRLILNGTGHSPTAQHPHITLMHPRNSTCTDEIFEKIKAFKLPDQLNFTSVSLIEQIDGGPWRVLEEFPLSGLSS